MIRRAGDEGKKYSRGHSSSLSEEDTMRGDENYYGSTAD